MAFVSQEFPSPIVEEWRHFDKDGTVVATHPYILDDWMFPDKNIVANMVARYTDVGCHVAPPTYVMDVAVLKDRRTALVEIHNFLACGLYGFKGQAIITMLKQAYLWELQYSPIGKENP